MHAIDRRHRRSTREVARIRAAARRGASATPARICTAPLATDDDLDEFQAERMLANPRRLGICAGFDVLAFVRRRLALIVKDESRTCPFRRLVSTGFVSPSAT